MGTDHIPKGIGRTVALATATGFTALALVGVPVLVGPASVLASAAPSATDSDGDHLTDDMERQSGTDPHKFDTDGDGLNDFEESSIVGAGPTVGCNALKYDTDADGLSDGYEVRIDTRCDNHDTDGDGLTDGSEVNDLHTSPKLADTDGDGKSDGDEWRDGGNPLGRDAAPANPVPANPAPGNPAPGNPAPGQPPAHPPLCAFDPLNLSQRCK